MNKNLDFWEGEKRTREESVPVPRVEAVTNDPPPGPGANLASVAALGGKVHLTRILPGASLTATRNERLAPARRAHAVEWGPEQSFTVEISYVPESIPTIKAG